MSTVTFRGPRILRFDVAGATFADGYPLGINRLAEHAAANDGVAFGQLVRDRQNPHDPNAIRVICPAAGGHIGHVPRSTAARLAPCLDHNISYDVELRLLVHPKHPTNPGIEARIVRRDHP